MLVEKIAHTPTEITPPPQQQTRLRTVSSSQFSDDFCTLSITSTSNGAFADSNFKPTSSMAVKIEPSAGSLADVVVPSLVAGPAPLGCTQFSLKSYMPSSPVLSRTGRPSGCKRTLVRVDSRAALAIQPSSVLRMIPRRYWIGMFWG